MIRLCFTYPVRSNIRLSAPEEIKEGDNLIEFIPDDKGRISYIRITVPAIPRKPPRDPEIPIERQAPDIMQPTIDPQASQQIESYIQTIEALADTFVGQFVVNRTEWKMEWCIDSEDKVQSIKGPSTISAFYDTKREEDVELDMKSFRKLILERDIFEDLIVPMIFSNHGFRDISEHRLITAYYNFFFVLEVLFAPGYSSPPKVENKFLSSAELKEAVDAVRSEYDKDILTANKLRRLLEKAHCEVTTEGIIKFFVKTRGKLHHANLPTSPTHWLPIHADRFSDEVDLLDRVVKKVIDIIVRKKLSKCK